MKILKEIKNRKKKKPGKILEEIKERFYGLEKKWMKIIERKIFCTD